MSRNPYSHQVQCLEEREGTVSQALERVAHAVATPMSALDVNSTMSFMVEIKNALKNVDMDIKEARRRVNAAKPKKGKAVPTDFAGSSASSVSGEED